jgi:outer membrane protein insertion porin family
MALGYFERVDLSTEPVEGHPDQLVVNVEVAERATGTFQIGAGFSSVENFIATAQIQQLNLFGRGQSLTLQAQLSGLRQIFSLRFVEPTSSTPTGPSRSTSTTRGLRAFGAFTSSARLTLQWDRRNNRLFPSKGFFHAAWVEAATDLLGSQNRFNRYGAFSRWYYPLLGPMILKLNGQIGVITSPDPNGVPIFERFFTGGIFDVRGFRPRSLGPRVFVLESPNPGARLFAFNKGGNKELVLNAEVEFPIFDKVGIRGVVFTDAGQAFDDDQAVSVRGLRHSWGFGLRWFSPIGPLRFEWGLPFAPEPDEKPIVFEFTIGNFF